MNDDRPILTANSHGDNILCNNTLMLKLYLLLTSAPSLTSELLQHSMNLAPLHTSLCHPILVQHSCASRIAVAC